MKLLGIDYGSKRIGIALSDENATFAFPHIVLAKSKRLLEDVQKVATEHTVREIVMGESKNYKGDANVIFSDSEVFKKELEDVGFTVFWEPEFMTSMQVERLQGKSELTDASAAAIILQSFLDKRKMGISS